MSNDDNFGPWIDWKGGECPIPDGTPHEAMTDLPSWAIKMAETVHLGRCLYDLTNNEWNDAIARALVAERERAALWHENEAHRIELEAHRKRGALAKTRQPLWHRRAAAAIRNQEPER